MEGRVSKTSSLRVSLAAACVLLASCASEPVAPPTAIEYRPVLRSTLVSNRDVTFVVAKWQEGAELTTVLARQHPGAAPHPVARLVQVRRGSELQVSIQVPPVSESVVLEQLYALVLRQEPVGRYCLASDGRPCEPARDGVSHAEVLVALASARDKADRGPADAPWRVVEMTGAYAPSSDADVVGVRAMADRMPLEGVAIYFNRAPHSLCIARTRADGVASCRLVDPHGDEHEHDHAAPVVATFPGDVRTERVLLPTTYVLPTPFAPRIPIAPPRRP
jgi:hypothetical protein